MSKWDLCVFVFKPQWCHSCPWPHSLWVDSLHNRIGTSVLNCLVMLYYRSGPTVVQWITLQPHTGVQIWVLVLCVWSLLVLLVAGVGFLQGLWFLPQSKHIRVRWFGFSKLTVSVSEWWVCSAVGWRPHSGWLPVSPVRLKRFQKMRDEWVTIHLYRTAAEYLLI